MASGSLVDYDDIIDALQSLDGEQYLDNLRYTSSAARGGVSGPNGRMAAAAPTATPAQARSVEAASVALDSV
jgi:hypothetical protein